MNHEESIHAAESCALNNLIFWVQISACVQFTIFRHFEKIFRKSGRQNLKIEKFNSFEQRRQIANENGFYRLLSWNRYVSKKQML